MRRRQSHDRGNIVLLLRKLDEVQVLAFLDITIVNDDDWRAALDFRAKLRVVLLLGLHQ